jgi:hypothetical protein
VTNWRLWCATRMAHRQGEEPSSHNAIMPDKEGRDKPQTTHVTVYLSTSKQRAPNKLQNPTPSPKPFPLSHTDQAQAGPSPSHSHGEVCYALHNQNFYLPSVHVRMIKELWCLFFALIFGFYIVLFGPNPILRVERALSFWSLLVL